MHTHTSLELNELARRHAGVSLRSCSADNFDEELSEQQATLLLDHILTDFGPAIYNQAAADARAYVEERATDLEAALRNSEFPISGRRRR